MKDYRQVVCKFMPESTCKLIPTKSDYNYLRGGQDIFIIISTIYKRGNLLHLSTHFFSLILFSPQH